MLSAYLKDDFKITLGVSPAKEEKEENETDINSLDIEDHSPEKQFESSLISKGYLPYSAGECYGRQLTKNSYVFIHKVKEGCSLWTGYRITYDEYGDVRNNKTIIQDNSFIRVMNRVETYIDNYLNFINKAR